MSGLSLGWPSPSQEAVGGWPSPSQQQQVATPPQQLPAAYSLFSPTSSWPGPLLAQPTSSSSASPRTSAGREPIIECQLAVSWIRIQIGSTQIKKDKFEAKDVRLKKNIPVRVPFNSETQLT